MRATTRILFIGNSYTARNDLPGTIEKLAASAKPPRHVETQQAILNGMALKSHWNRGDALRAIDGSRWDYVVLQEQSTLPLKNVERMHEYVRRFDARIRQRGAKTVLYVTWARQDARQRQRELTEAYMQIGRELGAVVAPVGVGWEKVLKQRPDLALYAADKSHPTPAASYLAACVFFATLFSQSPQGLAGAPAGLEPADVAYLQKIAATVAAQTTRRPPKDPPA